MKKLIISLSLLCIVGCSTTPQQVAYQATATTSVTVEQALAAYDVFAKAGKTTITENQQVAAAYAKYQAAFAVACDAGAIYAATSTTNSTASTAAFEQAVLGANQTITDLETLIASFGVQL